MTQIKLDLDSYSTRVLDVIKGQNKFKNRNQAFQKLIADNGAKYVKKTQIEKDLEQADTILENHEKKHPNRTMTDKELKDLLGL
jgi:CMP-N-acetylneuraminic acid synthetase